jgi:hypothetical protein
VTDLIVIRDNTFGRIGADGVQNGSSGPNAGGITFEGNICRDDAPWGGENCYDSKATSSGKRNYFRNNVVYPYGACLAATMECSGSPGTGVVLHDNGEGQDAHNWTVTGNLFYTGYSAGRAALVVNGARNTVIDRNTFDGATGSSGYSTLVTGEAANCSRSNNVRINGAPAFTWGPCE